VIFVSEIISKTESEISKLNSTPGGTHLRTGEIRKLSSRLFGELFMIILRKTGISCPVWRFDMRWKNWMTKEKKS